MLQTDITGIDTGGIGCDSSAFVRQNPRNSCLSYEGHLGNTGTVFGCQPRDRDGESKLRGD